MQLRLDVGADAVEGIDEREREQDRAAGAAGGAATEDFVARVAAGDAGGVCDRSTS